MLWLTLLNPTLPLGEIDKILDFFIEYSAGVIQIAQPLYAIKLLSIAAEKSRAAEVDEQWIDKSVEDSITDKGIILALMGLRNFRKYSAETFF